MLTLIQLYWRFVPAERRRVCLFKESCSNHIFRVTSDYGLKAGLIALIERFKNCRGGYVIISSAFGESLDMRLANGTIIPQAKISPIILAPYVDILHLEEMKYNQIPDSSKTGEIT